MKLRLAVIGIAAAGALAPLPQTWIEHWYSRGFYLRLQNLVTPASNLVPIALADVALAILSYALAVAAAAALALRSHPPRVCLALLAVFPIQHVCYGVGYLRRVGELALRRGRAAAEPALVPLSR